MQTDTATTESLMSLTIDLPDSLNSATSESDRGSWMHRVVFKPADLTVEVWTMYGSGTPEELWNGRVIQVGRLPDGIADLSSVRRCLESHAEDLRTLASLHSVEWDGSNNVGRYTDPDLANALNNTLICDVYDVAAECPRFWDAGEWLASMDDSELFPEGYADTQDARAARAEELVALARPDAHLDATDVASVLRRRWEEALDDADIQCEEADLFNDGGDANVNFTLKFARRKFTGTATLYFDKERLDWTVCGDCVCWLSTEVRERLDRLDRATARRLMQYIQTEAGYAALDAGLAAE